MTSSLPRGLPVLEVCRGVEDLGVVGREAAGVVAALRPQREKPKPEPEPEGLGLRLSVEAEGSLVTALKGYPYWVMASAVLKFSISEYVS